MRNRRAADTAQTSRSRLRRSLPFVAGTMVLEAIVMRLLGYRVGTHVVVRCRAGHMYSTIWIPGASVKALRLGIWRVQWCPVGRHWSIVKPVREAALGEDELAAAREQRDIRLP